MDTGLSWDHFYHSFATDNTSQQGVAIALTETVHKYLFEWEPKSPKLTRICLKGPAYNLAVLAVYVLTLDADNAMK